jgi:prevent-host-death family protein
MSTHHIATNDLRAELGRRIDEAHFRGTHLIVEKNGEPRAVLVPYHWWKERQAQPQSGLTPR